MRGERERERGKERLLRGKPWFCSISRIASTPNPMHAYDIDLNGGKDQHEKRQAAYQSRAKRSLSISSSSVCCPFFMMTRTSTAPWDVNFFFFLSPLLSSLVGGSSYRIGTTQVPLTKATLRSKRRRRFGGDVRALGSMDSERKPGSRDGNKKYGERNNHTMRNNRGHNVKRDVSNFKVDKKTTVTTSKGDVVTLDPSVSYSADKYGNWEVLEALKKGNKESKVVV